MVLAVHQQRTSRRLFSLKLMSDQMEGHKKQSRCRSSMDGGAQWGDQGRAETSCTVGKLPQALRVSTGLCFVCLVLAGPFAGELLTAYIHPAFSNGVCSVHSHHFNRQRCHVRVIIFSVKKYSTFLTDSLYGIPCLLHHSLPFGKLCEVRRMPNERVKLSPKLSAPPAAAFPRCNHSSQAGLGTSIQLPFCMQTAGCNRHRQASTGIKTPLQALLP